MVAVKVASRFVAVGVGPGSAGRAHGAVVGAGSVAAQLAFLITSFKLFLVGGAHGLIAPELGHELWFIFAEPERVGAAVVSVHAPAHGQQLTSFDRREVLAPGPSLSKIVMRVIFFYLETRRQNRFSSC